MFRFFPETPPTYPGPNKAMGVFFPFPSLLLDILAIRVYRSKFVSEKFYKKLPLFRHQPSNDIMWARLPSFCRLSGQREVVAVNLSPAPFPVHPCGYVQWLSFKITPIFLLLLLWGESREGPPAH